MWKYEENLQEQTGCSGDTVEDTGGDPVFQAAAVLQAQT